MFFRNRKNEGEDTATDRMAERIATRLIRWQQLVAAKVNRRINRVGKPVQKKLFWIACAAWSGILTLNIYWYYHHWTVSNSQEPYMPVHIGEASKPPVHLKKDQTTDSLTIQK